MTALDWLHGDWAPPVLSLWACAAAAVAAAALAARRRAERLLGPGSAPSARCDALLVAALLLVGLALLGPHLGTRTLRVPASGVDVVLAFDVSQSMLARDVPPSRLARARAVAEGLLAELAEGDRAALVAYAGRGVLLTPLTPDKDALRALVPALDTDLMEAGGSRLEAGVEAAAAAFRGASVRPRVIVVLGDGEDPERAAPVDAARAAAVGARVVGAWFGREDGASVPTPAGALRDASGREVRSRADPETLEALARATGGVVLRGDAAGRIDRERLLAEVRRDAPRGADGTVARKVSVQRSGALAAAALLLLLWIDLPARRRRGPSRLARSAAVALAAGLLGADAAQGEPDAATLLRLGVERAAEGEPDAARWTLFAAAVRADDARLAADAYYDLGVLALEQGDLEGARDAFFDALALAPGDRRAQFNLEWTLRALAATAAPPPPRDRRPSEEPEEPQPEEERPEEPERADPEAEARRTPRPAPAPESEPTERRQRPLELSPDAVERWLGRVKDDPARALRSAARAEGTSEPRSRRPHW